MTGIYNLKMKKFICIALTLIFVASTAFAFTAQPVQAEENKLYNEGIHHLYIEDGLVTEQEWKTESNAMFNASLDLEFDIAGMVIDNHTLKDYGLDFYLTTIYEQNEMGYGVNNDGIILGIDTEKKQFMLRTIGRGNEIFTKEKIKEVSNAVKDGWKSNSYVGALQAYRTKVVEIVSASGVKRSETEKNYGNGYEMKATWLEAPITKSAVGGDAAASTGDSADSDSSAENKAPSSNPGQLPDWYCTNPDEFVDFHNDSSVPRIIDNADILTQDEENQINAVISRIASEQNQDVVVYTDVTSYGIDNQLFANDFYTYNGYGYGDNFDGLILFVNMDPDNREMVTSACGSFRDTFTASVSSDLDDILYDHFVKKEYGDGVIEWIDAVEILMKYGCFDPPQWYIDYLEGKIPADANKYKVVDDLGYFSDEQCKEISDRLKGLSEKTGYDFAFYVTSYADNITNAGTTEDRVKGFTDLFYKVHGYGTGDDKSGILITFYVDDSSEYASMVTAYGSAKDQFTPKVCKQLGGIGLTNLGSGEYEKNIGRILDYTDIFLKKGKLPHTWPVRIFWFVLCFISGAIPATIAIVRAESKMKLVEESTSASGELVEDSFKILYSRDIVTDTRVSRVYDPVDTSYDDYSSGGGGSSSSYSSSSYSSSGREFSSSRRSF